MQVTLPSQAPVLDRRLLRRLLMKCQQQAGQTGIPQIASYSFPLPQIDPLSVLAHQHQPQHKHFYWQRQGQAIAAGGMILQMPDSGGNRFRSTEAFIESTLANSYSDGFLPSATGPYFCCGFSFFEPVGSDSPPITTVFVPQWTIVRQPEGCVAFVNALVEGNAELSSAELQLEQLATQLWATPTVVWPDAIPAFRQLETCEMGSAADFRDGVNAALQAIAAGELNKVVLAHAMELQAPQSIQPFLSLHNLRQLYPKCYIFSLGQSNGQQFMGASPEALMQIHQGRLAIDALAGSAGRGTTEAEDLQLALGLTESTKDHLEHRVVVDTIVQQLSSLGISAAAAASPNLLQLHNIQHLHTRICAQLPDNVHPVKILAALHPTPAVAGEPRELACDRIREWESFERGLYAAPVGWMDGRGNCELAVGIRSALVEGDRVRLCAGAGIVAGSDPEREWQEVQLKLQALVRALV